MNEELARESNGLYLSGNYTLNELAQKYNTTIGGIRYSWEKYELPTKLTKEAKSQSAKNGAARRNVEESNKKRQMTNLTRYGVDNVSQLEEISDKKRKSMSDKWDEIKQHRKDSLLAKYGVENVMSVPEIRNKQLNTLKNKYGTISPRRASIKNGGLLEDRNFIIKWAINFRKEHNRKPTPIELSEHLGFLTPNGTYKSIHSLGVEDYFLWRMTPLEELFENYIKELDIKYEHNNRTIIAPFEIDFWFPEFKIGIEINDVASHNSDMPFMEGGVPKPSNYHQEKAKKAVDANIRLIHLYEWELYDDKVMNFIKGLFNTDSQAIPARKTELKEISKKVANSFLDKYHLQGRCNGNDINIGLFYNNDLVSVMTFGKPRHSNDYQWELLRYCSSCRIVGGASKMFKYFISKCNKGDRILSFQDMDKFAGNLYDKLGFEYDGYTRPSYVWVKRDNIFNRYSWYVILHKGVDNVLGTSYGKGANNIELMKKEGYVRVYNSGMRKYVYTV